MAKIYCEKSICSPEKSSSPSPEEPVTEISPCAAIVQEGQLSNLQDPATVAAVKKPKISRTQFTIYQKVALENSFLCSLYLTGQERDALASKLGLSPVIVQTWFKNRRFKWRKESKKTDGNHPKPAMPTSPLLHYPSLPSLPYQHPCVGPEHQPPEGGSYGCCPINAPCMRYSSNTHW